MKLWIIHEEMKFNEQNQHSTDIISYMAYDNIQYKIIR